MNDSSWGRRHKPGTGGRPTKGLSRGLPRRVPYDAPEAQQTRPMPIVPDEPAYGGHQDDDRGPLG